jgi:hypothetical protein
MAVLVACVMAAAIGECPDEGWEAVHARLLLLLLPPITAVTGTLWVE